MDDIFEDYLLHVWVSVSLHQIDDHDECQFCKKLVKYLDHTDLTEPCPMRNKK